MIPFRTNICELEQKILLFLNKSLRADKIERITTDFRME